MPQITIKETGGQLVRQGLQDLGAEIPQIGRLGIYQTVLRARTKLRQPGKKPTYPIKWDSEKQRRAFFASDGFGGGIPTKRTNAIPNGWQLVPLDNGYQLINTVPGTQYVYGNAFGQHLSGIHLDTWNQFRDVVDAELATLPQEVQNGIGAAVKRRGLG